MASLSINRETLGKYLNEHLLASEAGIKIFTAARETWSGTPQELAFEELRQEIVLDHKDLKRIIKRCGLHQRALKRALTWPARRIGMLGPPNLLRTRNGSLSQTQLDMLVGMVNAKLAMWHMLSKLNEIQQVVDSSMLEVLTTRAERQIRALLRISDETVAQRFFTHG
jgi:hypothetical protein